MAARASSKAARGAASQTALSDLPAWPQPLGLPDPAMPQLWEPSGGMPAIRITAIMAKITRGRYTWASAPPTTLAMGAATAGSTASGGHDGRSSPAGTSY